MLKYFYSPALILYSIYHLILATARIFLHTECTIMKQKTDPASDSLISGINPPAEAPSAESGIPPAPAPIDLPVSPSSQPSTTVQDSQQMPAPAPQNMNEHPYSGFQTQSVQNQAPSGQIFTPTQVQTAETPFIQPPAVQTPDPIQTQNIPQNTSPFDPPPAPPQAPQPDPNPVDIGSKVVDEKPKKKTPVFLFILLLLVVIVLGAVGFLAYQNRKLASSVVESSIEQTSLESPALNDPFLGYVEYKSNILPIEFKHPSGWKIEESEDPDLANQKMVTATSSDFSYEGNAISQGFQFRVGPVNDLTKKYASFDSFAAEENAGGIFTEKTINGTKWLVKDIEAKTLISNSPLTIALYANTNGAATATEVFGKILNSFKIPVSVPTSSPATPSAAVSR